MLTDVAVRRRRKGIWPAYDRVFRRQAGKVIERRDAQEIVGRMLRLQGCAAYQWEFDEKTSTLTIWLRQSA